MTLPGLRPVPDGQVEGRHIRLPLQLIREPAEPVGEAMLGLYERLLSLTNAPVFHEGTWKLFPWSARILGGDARWEDPS